MSDLTTLSDEELMEQWTASSQAVIDAKEVNKAYADEFNRRETEKSAQEKLSRMTDAEREALGLPPAQTFEAEGIESEESVGESNNPDTIAVVEGSEQ